MPSIEVSPVEITNYMGKHEELALTVSRIPGGTGVVVRSTVSGEAWRGTFAGTVKLIATVAPGKVETLLDGGGNWTLSDRRVFGVIDRVDRSGNGAAAVFSFDASLLDEVEIQRAGLRNKVRTVAILGDGGAVIFDVFGAMESNGRFRRAGNEEFHDAAVAFVTAAHAAPAPPPDPRTQAAPAPPPDPRTQIG